MDWPKFYSHRILKKYSKDLIRAAVHTVLEEEGDCDYDKHIHLVVDIVVNDS
jgi:hypothetical protein